MFPCDPDCFYRSDLTKEEFIASLTDKKEDAFAKTFVAKANAMDLWSDCAGYVNEEGRVMAAIIVTLGKVKPYCANLQLLHTFHEFRGRNLAKRLVLGSYHNCFKAADYFRVSSEPGAVGFYEKLGFKFAGKQKSGCSLAIAKLKAEHPTLSSFDPPDQYIYSKIYSKGKGGCVEVYEWVNIMKEIDDWLDGFESEDKPT